MDYGRTSGPGISPDVLRELDRCTRACWAIDPLRSLLIAANDLGFQRLGMSRQTAPQPLDAAAPAIRRLREIDSDIGIGRSHTERLELWTTVGPVSVVCDVYRTALDPALLFIASTDSTESIAHRHPTRLPDPERPQTAPTSAPEVPVGTRDSDDQQSTDLPPRARDDASTLREIARRIREGQSLIRSGTANIDNAVKSRTQGNEPPAAQCPSTATNRDSDNARLAHELRTPLSAIVAASEIMKDERFGSLGNERYRGYAADIHQSARHALAVINSMLGVRGDRPLDQRARDASAVRLQFAEIDVNDIVVSAVSSMQPLTEQAALTLVCDTAPRLPHVVADPISVRQILLNLLTNALKFTGSGGRISVATMYRPDGPLTITVSDTGRGMSDEQIRKALDPDTDLLEVRRTPGSLGIGLSLVRTLAAANGATVSIRSSPGQGTRVQIAFDRARVIPI